MSKHILSIVAIAIALAAGFLAFRNKPVKVGYAETAVLMSEFSESKKAKKEFEAAKQGWDVNLKSLNDSLMATMDLMKAAYDKAPTARKDSMRTALQQRNEELQRYTNAVKKLSMDKERELMDPVIRKLNSFLETWGRENKYDLVLGTMNGGNILQANSDLNVTQTVLKALNTHYQDVPIAEPAPASDVKAPQDSATKATAP